jgi:transposase
MFRTINERIRELAGRFEVGREPVGFICECADETCVEKVELTLEQYDEMRALPARFVVVPGHEATPLVERVVFRNPGFVLVRKIGLAADAVLEQWPEASD